MDALTERRVRLLDVTFDDINLGQAAFAVLARRPSAPFAYIVTPNADHLQRLRRIPALQPVYERALLCLLDSRVISRLAMRLGSTHPQVVTGADLTATLLPRLAGCRVAVIGMTPRVIDALANRYPSIDFIHHQPPMNLLHNRAAFAHAQCFIETAAADLTFLAVGSPAQELLAYATAQAGRATGLGLCIGGALEFCAGTRHRAPVLLRRYGLEWAWRLACEPRRLAARYLLHDPPVLLRLVGEALRRT
jgi:exopolysaccharide biosynthesis WecB/TagA/CpsF family protein